MLPHPDSRTNAENPGGVIYPYLPEGYTYEHVRAQDPIMQLAMRFARRYSLDKNMPTCSVIVKDGKIIGIGTNGSTYHRDHEHNGYGGCERVRLGIPTGQRYELCEGCHPKNHAEPKAIAMAKSRRGNRGEALEGATLYLWGHWWACNPCWDRVLEAGITHLVLCENAETLFNKEAEGNIVGDQFTKFLGLIAQ